MASVQRTLERAPVDSDPDATYQHRSVEHRQGLGDIPIVGGFLDDVVGGAGSTIGVIVVFLIIAFLLSRGGDGGTDRITIN